MSQSTVVIILMSLGWLITVACFLLWVRHLQAGQTNAMKDKESDNSPIANSEQPVEPVRVFEYKPTPPKIPRGWKKADGKTRHIKTGLVDIMWGDGDIHLKQLAKFYHDAWIKSDFKTLDIIAYRECKPKKVFSSKPKTGKQRKTVTVKKRVTK
jgi:hypothetical protein